MHNKTLAARLARIQQQGAGEVCLLVAKCSWGQLNLSIIERHTLCWLLWWQSDQSRSHKWSNWNLWLSRMLLEFRKRSWPEGKGTTDWCARLSRHTWDESYKVHCKTKLSWRTSQINPWWRVSCSLAFNLGWDLVHFIRASLVFQMKTTGIAGIPNGRLTISDRKKRSVSSLNE